MLLRLAAIVNAACDGQWAGVAAVGWDWIAVVSKLQGFRTLEDDWDGDGSPAPEPALIDSAVRLARSLTQLGMAPADRAHLGPNATVHLEWHIAPRGYLVIEVVMPTRADSRLVADGKLEGTRVCTL